MPSIRIQTTQNVTVEYEVASVGDRILATLIDWAIYLAWLGVWGFLMSQLKVTTGTVFLLFLGLPIMLYPLLCEIFFDGRTLGKHARNLKVVKRSGGQPSLGDYLLRWLLIPIDLQFAGGVGILTMLLSASAQRLGDLAAGTAVVRMRPEGLRESTFAATSAAANYQVVYPQAATLTDRDATIIRQVLHEGLRRGNEYLLYETARRVKELTGIQSDQPAPAFLGTILRDHAHLAALEAER